jgi:hypothetical protein
MPGADANKGWPRRCPSEEAAMPRLPDTADLEALKAFDTPTICNALELVVPARRATGFTRRPLLAAFPEMKPVVAFARTAIIRSREPHPRGREEAKEVRLGYYGHIAAEPLPSIAVIQDIDAPDTGFGAFWGEVQTMSTRGSAVPASSPTARSATSTRWRPISWCSPARSCRRTLMFISSIMAAPSASPG